MNKELASADWINLILETLDNNGVSKDRVCKLAGINKNELTNQFSQIDASITKDIWDAAKEISGNEFIGLLLGKAQLSGIVGATYYGLLLAESVREAAEQVNLITSHLANNLSFEFEERKNDVLVKFICKPNYDLYGLDNIDSVLAYGQVILNHTFRGEIPPLKVVLTRKQPVDDSAYKDLFKCPIEFEQDYVGFHVRRDFFDSQQPTGNSILSQVYHESFRAMLQRETAESFSDRIKNHIYNSAPLDKDITLESVTKLFNYSKSTLKRKLKEEGFTFRELLDDTRKSLASDMIKNKSYQLQEIAYQLGYKETSPFYRAFKRWYGCTPSQYIEKL